MKFNKLKWLEQSKPQERVLLEARNQPNIWPPKPPERQPPLLAPPVD